MTDAPPSDAIWLVLTSLADGATARAIAEALVAERLAACVNLLPGAHSVYRWQGALCHDDEVLLLIKTTAARYPALQARLLALHPYALPELVALPLAGGHADYLAWVAAETTPSDPPQV